MQGFWGWGSRVPLSLLWVVVMSTRSGCCRYLAHFRTCHVLQLGITEDRAQLRSKICDKFRDKHGAEAVTNTVKGWEKSAGNQWSG